MKRYVGTRRNGFTLLEALVSLVIFGIVTLALSMAFSTAMHSQQTNTQRFTEEGTVRVVMNTLTRDIQAAYASARIRPASLSAGGGQGAGSQGSMGLLTFMTRYNRIQAPYAFDPNDPNSQNAAGGGNSTQITDNTPPQSDLSLIRYDLDTSDGRCIDRHQYPFLQNLTQTTNRRSRKASCRTMWCRSR